jgi:hypothetical protein
VVDARHHMLDRLSCIIAKELLNDQKVVIAHYEEICLSAGLARQGDDSLSALIGTRLSVTSPLSSGRRDVRPGPNSWDRGLRTSPPLPRLV